MSESRVMRATSVPILVFLGFSVLDLGLMYATDVRQHHRFMPRLGRGHNKLKHAGLNLKALTVIFQVIVVWCVSYAFPAWYGHLLQSDIGRINALFRKAAYRPYLYYTRTEGRGRH